MPNQKSFGQESPEEFETRCFLHVYKLLRNKNGEYVTQGIKSNLMKKWISFISFFEKFNWEMTTLKPRLLKIWKMTK